MRSDITNISNDNNNKVQNGWSRTFPYQVDYKDHFETPENAYQDIIPIIEWVSSSTTTTKKDKQQENKNKSIILYDPYYCNGRTRKILNRLGYMNVIHKRRDFYEDIANSAVPDHNVLVTNPPYSDDHKEKCINFCLDQLRGEKNIPFFILMPNYVAAREYYRNKVVDVTVSAKHLNDVATTEDVMYFIPTESYEYSHPEGTGKSTSPFASIWYCGLGKERIKKLFSSSSSSLPYMGENKCGKLAKSIDELRTLQVIPTKKRPNPRQRRKRKQQQEKKMDDNIARKVRIISSNKNIHTKTNSSRKKKSRYRDESGKRVRNRF